MKASSQFNHTERTGKKRGVCFICGLSTQLNIHAACSAAAEELRKKVKNGKKQSEDSSQRGARKEHLKNYKAGKLPGLSPKDLEV